MTDDVKAGIHPTHAGYIRAIVDRNINADDGASGVLIGHVRKVSRTAPKRGKRTPENDARTQPTLITIEVLADRFTPNNFAYGEPVCIYVLIGKPSELDPKGQP